MRNDIILEDTTLRDGEQAPGIAFSMEQKLEIHDALVDLGVRWIEVGIPAMGGTELKTLKALLERDSPARLVAWNRGNRKEISLSLSLGFTAVHIGLPTSPIHLKYSVGKDIKWLFSTAQELVREAKDHGAFVSISAEDVGRSELSVLEDYAGHVHEAGADRLRMSDTIGMLTPASYARRIEAVSRVCSIDIQCHAHNDFGLAVANTLAGLEAGARYFHVTVNGIGERAGMPDLAQVAVSLKCLYDYDLGLAYDKLWALARKVSQITGHPLPPCYPVVGNNVFSHESGIHALGMLNNAKTFEPFPPELVGGQRQIVIGKHSGRAALEHALTIQGIEVPPDQDMTLCLAQVREHAIIHGRCLSPEEIVDIYYRTF